MKEGAQEREMVTYVHDDVIDMNISNERDRESGEMNGRTKDSDDRTKKTQANHSSAELAEGRKTRVD